MVVGQDYRRGPKSQGWPKHLPRLERRDVQTSDRHPLTPEGLVSAIQIEHGEALPWAISEILKLEERLTGRGDCRRGAVGWNIPSAGQLANRQETPDLSGPKAVAAGRDPEVSRWPLDYAAFCEKRPQSG